MQNKGVMAILKFGGKNTPEEKIRNFFHIIFLFDQKPIHKKNFINFDRWEVGTPSICHERWYLGQPLL